MPAHEPDREGGTGVLTVWPLERKYGAKRFVARLSAHPLRGEQAGLIGPTVNKDHKGRNDHLGSYRLVAIKAHGACALQSLSGVQSPH